MSKQLRLIYTLHPQGKGASMFAPFLPQAPQGYFTIISVSGDCYLFTDLLRSVQSSAERYARLLCSSTVSTVDSASDLLQEALIIAWTQFPTLRHHQQFQPWLFSIIRSTHLSNVRRNKRRRTTTWDFSDNSPTGSDMSNAYVTRASIHWVMEMRQALQQLNRVELQALLLFTLGGFSVKELSDHQQCTISCMKKRLERAREKMRRHLNEKTGALIVPKFSGDIIEETFNFIDEVVNHSSPAVETFSNSY